MGTTIQVNSMTSIPLRRLSCTMDGRWIRLTTYRRRVGHLNPSPALLNNQIAAELVLRREELNRCPILDLDCPVKLRARNLWEQYLNPQPSQREASLSH